MTSVAGGFILIIAAALIYKWWIRRRAARTVSHSDAEKDLLPSVIRVVDSKRWSDMSEANHPLLLGPTSPTSPSARSSRVFPFTVSKKESDPPQPQTLTRASTQSSFFIPPVPLSPPPNTSASHTVEAAQTPYEPRIYLETKPMPPLPVQPILPSIRHEPSIELFHPSSLIPARGVSRPPSRAPSSRVPSRASSMNVSGIKRDKSRKKQDLRSALLTRMASNRSGRYTPANGDDAPPSPSSVYSQASAGASVWADFEGGIPEEDIPPLPPLPEVVLTHESASSQSTIKPYNPFTTPSSDPIDREISRFEESFTYPGISRSSSSSERDNTWVSNAVKGLQVVPTSPDDTQYSRASFLLDARKSRAALPAPTVQDAFAYQGMPQYAEVEDSPLSSRAKLSFTVSHNRGADYTEFGRRESLSTPDSFSREDVSLHSRRDGLVMA